MLDKYMSNPAERERFHALLTKPTKPTKPIKILIFHGPHKKTAVVAKAFYQAFYDYAHSGAKIGQTCIGLIWDVVRILPRNKGWERALTFWNQADFSIYCTPLDADDFRPQGPFGNVLFEHFTFDLTPDEKYGFVALRDYFTSLIVHACSKRI